jgi:predicted nucleotidyltransferase
MATRTEGAQRCRRKFLKYFPKGFNDATYLSWERDYKWESHERWGEALGQAEFRRLLGAGAFAEIANRAVRVEQRSRHSMIFSFEKMALRDAIKSEEGARLFAEGLYKFLHGAGDVRRKFERWVETVDALPRKQTRVLTWPLVTVFSFIAQPDTHIFLKPNVTRTAARAYGFDFQYKSRPSWETYASYLAFTETIRRDLSDLKPRDMIDIQSFIWVQGSDEYPDE